MKIRSRKILSLTLAAALILTLTPITALATDYEGHWAEEYMADARDRGWIEGDDEGLFRPDGAITRAEFAVMLWRALDEPEHGADNPFTDIAKSDWFYDATVALYELGIVSGYGGGVCGPGDTLTREMCFTMMARAFSVTTMNRYAGNVFSDAGDISGWARSHVSALLEKGYIQGVGGNLCLPQADMTRGDMIKLLITVFDGEEGTEKFYVTYPIVEDFFELAMWGAASSEFYGNIGSMANHPAIQEAEDITNIAINWVEANLTHAMEMLAIMFASGDYTDMIKARTDDFYRGLLNAFDNNILIDLAEYIPTYAPDYWKLISLDDDIWRDAVTTGDNILAFYTMQKNPVVSEGNAVRYDLLTKIALETPTTYDEYHELLTVFKVEYGMSNPLLFSDIIGYGLGMDSYLLGGYGVNWGFYRVDGEIKYGRVEDGYYDFLKMMNRWYNEGLINADFYVIKDTPEAGNQSLILSGQAGIITGLDAAALTTYPKLSSDSGFRLTAIPDATVDGTGHELAEMPKGISGDLTVTVTKNCGNPEIAVRWMNFWYGGYGAQLASYGIEYTSFTYDASGRAVYTELVTNNPDKLSFEAARQLYTLVSLVPTLYDMQSTYSFYNSDSRAASDIWTKGFSDDRLMPAALSYPQFIPDGARYLMADIATYTNEACVLFITGMKELNEENWSYYRQQLFNMGIGEVIKLYQEALDKYYAS